MYRKFIGVDVGKQKLNVYLDGASACVEIPNTRICIERFFLNLAGDNTLVVLENTGGYEKVCAETLHDMGFAVHKTNNRFAKAFVKSLGQKAKTDAIDAGILARYGRERQDNLRLYKKSTRNEEALKQLVIHLEDLERLRILENNRMKSGGRTSVTKSIARITNFLDREIRRTEQEMNKVADSDEALNEKISLLCEYKGIGRKTALYLIAFYCRRWAARPRAKYRHWRGLPHTRVTAARYTGTEQQKATGIIS